MVTDWPKQRWENCWGLFRPHSGRNGFLPTNPLLAEKHGVDFFINNSKQCSKGFETSGKWQTNSWPYRWCRLHYWMRKCHAWLRNAWLLQHLGVVASQKSCGEWPETVLNTVHRWMRFLGFKRRQVSGFTDNHEDRRCYQVNIVLSLSGWNCDRLCRCSWRLNSVAKLKKEDGRNIMLATIRYSVSENLVEHMLTTLKKGYELEELTETWSFR
jgi:hypothetical protein